MSPLDIQFMVEAIKQEINNKDWEAVRSLQESLMEDFINSLSERKDPVGRKAKLISKIINLEYPRW
ncbi:hypothetical protein LCGC14_0458550 [marine sediment metagenome]|uniref:Uncharacterized protein n=1 Tax=marine sediment metagenome TaxID=412755 RepID=A0A0F9SKY6_9ZZZZ